MVHIAPRLRHGVDVDVDRQMQRRPALMIPHIQIGTGLGKGLDHRQVLVLRSSVEQRPTGVRMCRVDVAARR